MGRGRSRDEREGPGVQPEHLEGGEEWPRETGPADVAAAGDEATPSPPAPAGAEDEPAPSRSARRANWIERGTQ